MRPALRLLAAVRQPAPSRTMVPNAPTGLTGLATHPSPRSTLIYLYNSILSKMDQIPPHSVYRQATEALTKHRLAIVESVKPEGWDVWADKVDNELSSIDDHIPDGQRDRWEAIKAGWLKRGNQVFVKSKMWHEPKDYREVEWDGEPIKVFKEGAKSEEEMTDMLSQFEKMDADALLIDPSVTPEPLLTLKQVEDLEQRIGAGLIEEVIQVAEGENKLADTMIQHKVWEDLAEKAPQGQWVYFERSTAS